MEAQAPPIARPRQTSARNTIRLLRALAPTLLLQHPSFNFRRGSEERNERSRCSLAFWKESGRGGWYFCRNTRGGQSNRLVFDKYSGGSRRGSERQQVKEHRRPCWFCRGRSEYKGSCCFHSRRLAPRHRRLSLCYTSVFRSGTRTCRSSVFHCLWG